MAGGSAVEKEPMRRFFCIAVLAAAIVTVHAFTNNDFRVTAGFGDRSGTHVRVTFVTPQSTPVDPEFESVFSYNDQFKYRWTTMRTHTSLFNVTQGQTTTISIPTASDISITLPTLGAGVRGLMMADVCFASTIAKCEVGPHDQIFSRLPALINAIVEKSATSFYGILGDNFYDANGTNTQAFWATLTPLTKSKLLFTAPGNYDFWSSGDETEVTVPADQFGNGFMQYYGVDAESARYSLTGNPWNFSVDPDHVALSDGHIKTSSPRPNQEYLPDASNFQAYTQVGNLGIITYSGAHNHDAIKAFMEEACVWMAGREETIDWILLMGHWGECDKGADDATCVPGMYKEIITYSGCPTKKVKYFAGHKHCNMVLQPSTGFLVGAFGKSNNHCSQFGIPYIDSTEGRLLVVYFPISEAMVPSSSSSSSGVEEELRGANERFEALKACADSGPLIDCVASLDHEVWLNETAH
jgi:hypothetical protein